MHARSERLNINDSNTDIENKIEDGICELIALIIHKTIYNSPPRFIAYPEYVQGIIGISKIQDEINMLNICLELLLTPYGKRLEAINNVIKFEYQNNSLLTEDNISSIKQNLMRPFRKKEDV